MSCFPVQCVHIECGKKIVVSEKNRKFVLKNPNKIHIRKIYIDDCLIKDVKGQLACDYGICIDKKNMMYLVELKGMDIVHACKQIFETTKYIKEYYSKEINGKDLYAAIVCSKFSAPKLKVHPTYVKLKKLVRHTPMIKTTYLEVHC